MPPLTRPWLCAILAAALAGCRADLSEPDLAAYNPDWSQATHGLAEPDYAVVFPQASVNSLEITMTAAQWAAIRANMRALTGGDFGVPGPVPPGLFTPRRPDYVDVTVRFNGKVWKNVGFRLKGNSSLRIAWHSGNYKLPFRLDMDRFGSSIRAVADQRFHGFDELSMATGAGDDSLIREKLASDVYRMAGIPAPRTAFYRVSIDFGQGLRYCGLYTAVEVIEDTMVESDFGSGEGNVYEPRSTLRTFDPAEFEKKNNQDAADWSDVRAFVTALNSPRRTSDPPRWRAGLEATFDVDHFLKWLAAKNTIVNWDSYGTFPNNYQLFHHPTRRLVWIPWDNSVAFLGSPGVTGVRHPVYGGPGEGIGMSLTMNEVDATWPLLRYLADDPVYFARYREHVRTFAATVFTEANIGPVITRYHELVAPHAVGPAGERPGYGYLPNPTAFADALPALQAHVRARAELVAGFLR